MGETHLDNMTSRQRVAAAVGDAVAPRARRIGIGPGFLPVDAFEVLREALPEAPFGSAPLPLEPLRTIVTSAELKLPDDASAGVVEAMLAVVSRIGVGSKKAEISGILRAEETL